MATGVWPEVSGGPQLAGKRDGTWTYWDTDGKLVAEGQWKSGRPWDGTCLVPHRSGSLWVGEQGRYREGKVIGSVKQVMDF